MLADLRRAPRVERVDLHGLDEDGMRAFLVAAGGADLEDEGVAFARRLVEETDGNPFFVTEVIRHLVETGMLEQRDGRWVGTRSRSRTSDCPKACATSSGGASRASRMTPTKHCASRPSSDASST